jgi:hypothetical protein
LGIGGKLKKIYFDPKNAQKFVLEYFLWEKYLLISRINLFKKDEESEKMFP